MSPSQNLYAFANLLIKSLMSTSQNLYAFANLLIKYLLKYLLCFLLHFKYLNIT